MTLDPVVASTLANYATERRNERRDYNDAWPEDTRVVVALGLPVTHGPGRSTRDGSFDLNPNAAFGFNLPAEGLSEESLIYAAYLRSVLKALEHDEINRYRSKSAAANVLHPVRFVALGGPRQRRDRKIGELASDILLTIPRTPLSPLRPLLRRIA